MARLPPRLSWVKGGRNIFGARGRLRFAILPNSGEKDYRRTVRPILLRAIVRLLMPFKRPTVRHIPIRRKAASK